MAQLCRTPLQVQRIAWEAIKRGYEEGEKQISRETILSVIAPDFRDIRTELKRLGYTVRDIAYDYSVNAKQVNRFLDGKLPADDPVTRQIAVFLNADFHGAKPLNVSLWDYPGFARKFGKFATETLIGLFCQAWF